jgi:hypothetical protein
MIKGYTHKFIRRTTTLLNMLLKANFSKKLNTLLPVKVKLPDTGNEKSRRLDVVDRSFKTASSPSFGVTAQHLIRYRLLL